MFNNYNNINNNKIPNIVLNITEYSGSTEHGALFFAVPADSLKCYNTMTSSDHCCVAVVVADHVGDVQGARSPDVLAAAVLGAAAV